jgi:hypothetical protein
MPTVPPPPRARQGALDGRVRPHKTAFVEAAEGDRGRGGNDERAPARRGLSGGATTGGNGRDSGHDNFGHCAVGSVSAYPRRWRSADGGGHCRR